MKRNPGSTWLVTLKSRALTDWIYQNEPRLIETAFVLFDLSYGFDAPAADRSFVVSAADRKEAIQRGLAAFNAAALARLLDGEPGAYRDAVLFNAAAALIVAGEAADWAQGITIAARSIDSRAAHDLLTRWIDF